MKIVAMSQVWNVAQFIAASIIPIHKYVDEIWLFDGAYQQIADEAKVPWSTDGTLQVAESLKLDCKLRCMPCNHFWKDEMTKRKYMMSFLNDGEIWFNLMDDEILAFNVEAAFKRLRESKARVGYVPRIEFPRAPEIFKEPPEDDINPHEYMLEYQLRHLEAERGLKYNNTILSRAAFLKYEDGVHYSGKAWSHILDKNEQHYTFWRPRIWLDDMMLWHVKYLRETSRLKTTLKYEELNPALAN